MNCCSIRFTLYNYILCLRDPACTRIFYYYYYNNATTSPPSATPLLCMMNNQIMAQLCESLSVDRSTDSIIIIYHKRDDEYCAPIYTKYLKK